METQHIIHNFDPIYNEHSKILMLGTMPSPKSREVGFYYGHPRNRFWKVVSDVCGEAYPETREDKIAFALRNGIAVWDVLAGCDIKGADDSSIRNPQPNDLSRILTNADIKAIFTTGTKAFQLYKKFCYPRLELWQSDYHQPVRQIAEHRMNSCMRRILKLRNIYNKNENRYQM